MYVIECEFFFRRYSIEFKSIATMVNTTWLHKILCILSLSHGKVCVSSQPIDFSSANMFIKFQSISIRRKKWKKNNEWMIYLPGARVPAMKVFSHFCIIALGRNRTDGGGAQLKTINNRQMRNGKQAKMVISIKNGSPSTVILEFFFFKYLSIFVNSVVSFHEFLFYCRCTNINRIKKRNEK